MNVLSTIYALGLNVLAADAKDNVEPSTPWFGADGLFQWWQVLLIFVLLGLVGFFFWNKKRQES